MRASNFATFSAVTGSLAEVLANTLPSVRAVSEFPSGASAAHPAPVMVSILRFPPKSDVFRLLLGVAVAPDGQIARLEPPGTDQMTQGLSLSRPGNPIRGIGADISKVRMEVADPYSTAFLEL